MRTPNFWRTNGLVPCLLTPFSWLYAAGAALDRRCTSSHTLSVPVISIGNITAGGAGKTPTTIALTKLLRARGRNPHILSRGYGAKIAAPLKVDVAQHSAVQAGDEALLLAHAAPTWVYPKRKDSGNAAINDGANVLVCDDALQHHALAKSINLLVIDGAYGVGNGKGLPAGPLRESLSSALARVDAVIIIGADVHGLAKKITMPVFTATMQATGDVHWLKDTRIIAFAGIARPQKFYDTLTVLGAQITTHFDFADHHVFSEEELKTITTLGAAVTTEKDWVRLSPEWKKRIRYVPVEVVFDDIVAIGDWLEEKLHA